jgi:tetratricopeptide (TPR) repeat protein
MKPHAFIAMPFNTKKGPDGKTDVDFNQILARLFRPALERADFEVFRADEEMRAGDIREDMFQELLVADLVLVDLTIHNPNVWYELGVRHALRSRGVVLVYGAMPGIDVPGAFDVYTDRKLRYTLTADGQLDPACLDKAIDALATMARETREASTRRIVSPVYKLLPNLEQPQWRKLLMTGDNEFSGVYKGWEQRVKLARRGNRAGDILTLADETPTRSLALEAHRAAGDSLLQLRQPALALEQFDAALGIEPDDLLSRQKRGVCLGRIGAFDEARLHVQALTERYPQDAESWALYGRVEKDGWIDRWRGNGSVTPDAAALQAAAADEDAMLADAIEPYRKAFSSNPAHYYSGINALTLSKLRVHLGGADEDDAMQHLLGGVRWAVSSALEASPKDYWARATLAELSLLSAELATVNKDWRAAVAAADRDWFALDSSRQTLLLLSDLGFRPAETAAALRIVEAELARSIQPFVPRQVLLFSGHMMDRPDRADPRFPPAMEAAAAKRITLVLDRLAVGEGDQAYSQAASGGDLLFLEACVARKVRCQVLLPCDESEFVQTSMLPSINGAQWRERWQALKPGLGYVPRIMPTELGQTPKGANRYERCNRWLLNSAVACGPDKLRFIGLWNGAEGDGPGGSGHLMKEAQKRTAEWTWIDTRTLV